MLGYDETLEEIFEEEETEETSTAVVTEVITTPFTEAVTTQNVTEETTTVFYDEYGFEVTTASTEIEAILSQVSEVNSYAAVVAENTTEIKAQTEIEVVLLFAVIAFCGMVCGLLIANCIKK